MRRVAVLLACVVLLAGCVATDSGSPDSSGRSARKHVDARPRSVETAQLPNASAMTWEQLHDNRLVFSTDPGRWAVLSVKLDRSNREPSSGAPTDGSSVRYSYAVDAKNATDAFVMSGWSFAGGTPSLNPYPISGSSGGGGACGGSCEGAYVLIVGARTGTVTASFGLLARNDDYSPGPLLARPALAVAKDYQGARYAFGNTFRNVDPTGASTWYDYGAIHHEEGATVGPLSNHRTTVVNASIDMTEPGMMLATFFGGGQGQLDGAYALQLGARHFADRSPPSSSQPRWDLRFLTPPGPLSLRFTQNVTGTEAVSNLFVGQVSMRWFWLDADLPQVLGWRWDGIDARDG